MAFRYCLLATLLLGMIMAPLGAQVSSSRYSTQDLENLVAPVALYPDTLLTHVLTGATAPNQITRARQLSLSGVKSAQAPKDLLPSVAALLDFSDVLAQMANNPDWTMALGYAVNAQCQDVMKAVQQVRTRAYVAGNLKSSAQLTVQQLNGVIVIASPTPQVIYVPQYTPTSLYTPGAALVSFGLGMAVGNMFWSGACHWGSGFYYGPPGAYAHWAYRPGYMPPGAAWHPHPTPYSGLPAYRPGINHINYNNVNVNHVNVNNVNVSKHNNVNVNNVNVSKHNNVNVNKPRMGGETFRYERGVDARQSSLRGRQSLNSLNNRPRPSAQPASGAVRPTFQRGGRR